MHSCSDFSVSIPQCRCKWIDAEGDETPDNHPAIGMAVCYNPATSWGEKGSEPFPICQDHAVRRGKYWKILPLPGQAEKDWHGIVKYDAQVFKVVPQVVIDSIRNNYPPEQSYTILLDLQWDSLNGCFSFVRDGVYYGVEKDGYIHT